MRLAAALARICSAVRHLGATPSARLLL
jgi:hypothetical protein